MRIVTSGKAFIDIDAFAGCVAYAELLKLLGETAYPVSSAPWNESISPTVRSWGAPLLSKYNATPSDTFTLIDISDAKYFDPIVAVERVDEVIDHHPGFEDYWRERLGKRAQIEFIGAACTLVAERWIAAGKLGRINPITAQLLMTGILDNTLNFGARITTDRDKSAYAALTAYANLPADWPAQYFSECEATITADIAEALHGAIKPAVVYPGFAGEVCAAQLAVWDGPGLLHAHLATLRKDLATVRPQWFLNLISIGDGASYIICDDPALQAWLAQLLDLKFEDGIAHADRFWLRKEIMQQAITKRGPSEH